MCFYIYTTYRKIYSYELRLDFSYIIFYCNICRNIPSTLILPSKTNKSYYSSIVTNKFSNIHEHRKISEARKSCVVKMGAPISSTQIQFAVVCIYHATRLIVLRMTFLLFLLLRFALPQAVRNVIAFISMHRYQNRCNVTK